MRTLRKYSASTFWFFVTCPLFAQPATPAEAKAQVDQYWGKRIARCGDISYIRNATGEWKALRNLRWDMVSQPLNQADLLNGTQWMGSTSLVADVSRHWHETTGWQQWEQGIGPFGGVNLTIVKRNGAWSLKPGQFDTIALIPAPRCSDVPPEPTRKTNQQVANEKAQEAPRLCLQYLSSYTNYASIDSYIQQGLNPKTCRGDGGITPLMAIADHCFSGALQAVFEAGVDVNATDTQGRTALDYAMKTRETNDSSACYSTLTMLNAAGARAGGQQAAQPTQPANQGQPPDNAARVKLRLVKEVPPQYPQVARQAKVQGDVSLLIKINEDGFVVAATVLHGHQLLNEAALQAVSQYRYTMTIREIVSTTVTVKFRLPAESK